MKDKDQKDKEFMMVLPTLKRATGVDTSPIASRRIPTGTQKDGDYRDNLLSGKDGESKQVQQNLEHLRLLTSLNQAANRGVSFQELLNVLSRGIKRILLCWGVGVYLLTEDKEHLVIQNVALPSVVTETIEKLIGRRIGRVQIPLKHAALYQRILDKRTPQIINDSKTIQRLMAECTDKKMFKRLIPTIYRTLGITSVLMIPLISEGEIVGLIDASRKGPFQESDLSRLELISQQVTLLVRHRLNEERIHKSHNLLDHLLNSMHEELVVINPADYIIEEVNNVFLKNHRITREESIGQRCYAVSHQRSRPCSSYGDSCPLEGVMKTKSVFCTEHMHRDYEGKELLFKMQALPLFGPTGQIQLVLELGQDITQDKRKEKELTEQHGLLEDLMNNIPDPIYFKDDQNRFVLVNNAKAEESHATPEEMVGKRDLDYYSRKQAKQMASDDNRVRQTGEPLIDWIQEVTYPDGTNKWFSTTKIARRDSKGTTVGSMGISRDITERQKAEKRLRQSEERYRRLFHLAPVGITTLNMKGVITSCNPSVYEKSGYSEDDFVGKHFSKIATVRPENIPEYIRVFASLLLGKIPKPFETNYRCKDGTVGWTELHISLLKEKDKKLSILVLQHDITRRKKVNEALEKSAQEWRSTFDSISNSVLLLNRETRVLRCNEAARDLLGKPYEEIIGQKIGTLADAFSVDTEGSSSVVQILEQHSTKTWQVPMGSGWFSIALHPIKDGTKKLVGAVQIITDITKRKDTENRLGTCFQKLKKVLEETIHVLASTVEIRDPYTAGHQKRVTHLARAIAKEMGLAKERVSALHFAATVHDLGKICIPSEILAKPSRLNKKEFALIAEHPQVGYDILKEISFPWPIAKIILQHHERMDGSGYPQGLSGKDILLEARIIAVADVVEAMSSHRPYRATLGIDKALEEISGNNGRFYDPEVVDTCVKLFTEKGFRFSSDAHR